MSIDPSIKKTNRYFFYFTEKNLFRVNKILKDNCFLETIRIQFLQLILKKIMARPLVRKTAKKIQLQHPLHLDICYQRAEVTILYPPQRIIYPFLPHIGLVARLERPS